MKTLILVAVIIQLVITIVGSHDFKFGDIISYPPRCKMTIKYKHFAVYVGDEPFPGKKEGEDIFERLKSTLFTRPLCVFNKLNMSENPELSNYLDGYKDEKEKEYKRGTDKEITERINDLYKKCGPYGLLHNNCEHLATYVRYGVKIALQFDLPGKRFCINPRTINSKDMRKYVREARCSANPDSPASSSGGSPAG